MVYGGFIGTETALQQRDEGLAPLNETILSGDIGTLKDRSDNVYHVVTAHNVGPLTKLSGFTIRDGNADAAYADPHNFYERMGGGILIVGTRDDFADPNSPANQSSLQVTRCYIQMNDARNQGGGVAVIWPEVVDPNSPARFVNCHFYTNGVERDTTSPDDLGHGGGISVNTAAFEVTNCVFTSNDALDYHATGNPTGQGGAYVTDSTSGQSLGTFSNCTLVYNKGLPGAIQVNSSASPPVVFLNNSICWDNYPDPNLPDHEVDGAIDVSYSDIRLGWAGASSFGGNINADPQLNASFKPNAGSPCIDTASNALVPSDNADVDDDPNTIIPIPWDRDKFTRIVCVVEMGAFEVQCEFECIGDFNGDNAVGLSDLTILLSNYGLSGVCGLDGDLDCDGDVDLSDLTVFMANFGNTCNGFTGGEGGGEGMSGGGSGESDLPTPEFVDWARQATLEELFSWRDEWIAGQPYARDVSCE